MFIDSHTHAYRKLGAFGRLPTAEEVVLWGQIL